VNETLVTKQLSRGERGPRKAQKEATYLTEEEIERFFRVIRSIRDRAIFRLMYHRGLRASEPGRLMYQDYRPGPGRPRLLVRRCKGSITAEHVLLDIETKALKAWTRVYPWPAVQNLERNGPLFPSRDCPHKFVAGLRGKRGISSDMIEVLFRRYCILAGIPLDKAHPHSLKHSCGTHVTKWLNGNIVEVQDHMGHADIRNTMRYVRSTERETRADRLAGWGG
jgi:integrase